MPQSIRLVTAALALLVVAAGVRVARARTMQHLVESTTYEDVYYVPPPEWLPVLSAGYDEALANLLWIRALLYFGEELQHRGAVAHAYDYADAILALDPDFRRVYRWIGMVAMYRPVDTTVEDIRRGIAYLERGARRFPMDGTLAWDLGAALAYELAPYLEEADARTEAKRRGVEHMQVAARLGVGPPWLVLANASQLARLGRTEQAIRHLEEMYGSVQDAKVRADIETRLAELRSEAEAAALTETVRETEARRERDFPYVDAGLFLLLGARPPVDAAGGLARRFAPPEGSLGGSPPRGADAPR